MRAIVTDELLRVTVLEYPLVYELLCDRVSLDSLEVEGTRQICEPIREDHDEAEFVLKL